MDGYYDYHATVILERPVLLIGFAGAAYRQVGRDTSSLTGLPFVDVDQWVEHEAGLSLRALVAERGKKALAVAQRRLTARALKAQPPGIIVLGDGAVAQHDNFAQALQRGFVVYFRQSLSNAYWALRQQVRERGPLPQPHLPEPLDTIAQLRPLFAAREPIYEQAHLCIDMEESGIEGAVRTLMQALPAQPDAPGGSALSVVK